MSCNHHLSTRTKICEVVFKQRMYFEYPSKYQRKHLIEYHTIRDSQKKPITKGNIEKPPTSVRRPAQKKTPTILDPTIPHKPYSSPLSASHLWRNQNRALQLLNHHARKKATLSIQRIRILEDTKLEIVPLLCGPLLAGRIIKDTAIIHAQKVGHAVTVLKLRLVQGHNAVDDASQLATREEA